MHMRQKFARNSKCIYSCAHGNVSLDGDAPVGLAVVNLNALQEDVQDDVGDDLTNDEVDA